MYQLSDEEYCCETHQCSQCESYEQKLYDIKYWLDGIVDQIYSVTPLDLEDLENCLQELAAHVSSQIPKHAPTIQRKPKITSLDHALKEWVHYNNRSLQTI